MAWNNPLPPLPVAITSLTERPLRRRAEAAWKALHTIVDAISAWEDWLSLAQIQYGVEGKYDIQTGDSISRDGASAIRTLCGLNLRCDAFSGDGEHLLFLWPDAPSDSIDPTWYVGMRDKTLQERIDEYRFHSWHILEPAARRLLDDLERSPDATFDVPRKAKPTADGARVPKQPALGGRPRKWDHLWRIIVKHKAQTGIGVDQTIANEHNRICGSRIANGTCEKIDADKVKEIRYEYTNRKQKRK